MTYKYWYPTFEVEVQRFLPGIAGKVTPKYEAHNDVAGHIVREEGKLLCGKTKRYFLEKTKALKSKVVDKPLAGVVLCKKCLKIYSSTWRSDSRRYRDFVAGKMR